MWIYAFSQLGSKNKRHRKLPCGAVVVSRTVKLAAEADAAHRYMKRYGRPHPTWGIGSLETRANALGAAGVAFDLADPQILASLALLAHSLATRNLALPPAPPV